MFLKKRGRKKYIIILFLLCNQSEINNTERTYARKKKTVGRNENDGNGRVRSRIFPIFLQGTRNSREIFYTENRGNMKNRVTK